MLLVLTPPAGERKLWVTRRLWLAVYRQIAALSEPLQEEPPKDEPPVRPTPISQGDAAGAQFLESVNIATIEEGAVRVTFLAEGGPISIVLKDARLARFRYLLETQTDRAGWDGPAAMERLRAREIAGAAVRRASA